MSGSTSTTQFNDGDILKNETGFPINIFAVYTGIITHFVNNSQIQFSHQTGFSGQFTVEEFKNYSLGTHSGSLEVVNLDNKKHDYQLLCGNITGNAENKSIEFIIDGNTYFLPLMRKEMGTLEDFPRKGHPLRNIENNKFNWNK
jgi:hypothetical protein